MNGPKQWMKKLIPSLKLSEAFEIAQLPGGKKTVKGKWVCTSGMDVSRNIKFFCSITLCEMQGKSLL